jgi:hypothetical protein
MLRRDLLKSALALPLAGRRATPEGRFTADDFRRAVAITTETYRRFIRYWDGSRLIPRDAPRSAWKEFDARGNALCGECQELEKRLIAMVLEAAGTDSLPACVVLDDLVLTVRNDPADDDGDDSSPVLAIVEVSRIARL